MKLVNRYHGFSHKNFIFKAFLFISFLTTFNLHSQTNSGEVEKCSQHKKLQTLKENPAFLQLFLQEQAILKTIEQQVRDENSPNRLIYTVPVVFHVLHNGGEENISNAQILDGLEVLNRDFRRLNADANNVVFEFNASNPDAVATPADIEIQFVLATKTPEGECFDGITRTFSDESYSGNGEIQLSTIIAENDTYNAEWYGDMYLNVFICGDIGGAAGYTNYPSDWFGNSMANGVFILHDYLGRIGTGSEYTSRVLTHEVGHWLNLSHVWGSNNDPGDIFACETEGDEVDDTPPTIGSTSCLLTENSCGPKANVENYMDYSYCERMFTHGQKDRMRAALVSSIGGRNNLSTASNLVATGADGDTYLCAAAFSSTETVICSGGSVQFFDNSYNNVTSWNWSFPGGDITNSTEQNPTITYNTPGTYTVSLTAGDGNTNQTLTQNQYITVMPIGESLPVLEGFEPYNALVNSDFWETYNPQNNAKFELTSAAALGGEKSAFLSNFTQSGVNTDELISGPVDLSSVTATNEITLSFRYSYRKLSSGTIEKLFVLMTGNCGDTWEIKKSMQGSALSTLSSSSSWVPSQASDWTTVHLTNITSAYWNENYRFKFKFESNNGNNIYFDNINIYKAAPSEELIGFQLNGIEENAVKGSLTIYPNPADNELNISYFVNENGLSEISIIDMLGKKLDQKIIHSASGNNLVVLDTEHLAPGIYTARIKIGGTDYNKQFIIK